MSRWQDLGPQIKPMLGFLVSGIAAFVTDAGVTKAIGLATGWPWGVCRLGGIMVAMVVAWACHRRLTFAVTAPPSAAEFGRYVALAWTTAALNYALFLSVLWLRPGTDSTLAIGVSSILAMAYSYLGMRYGVFTRR
jgi:putative flippase GtrA